MTREESLKKIKELVEDIRIAMLVTETEDEGELRSRPMYTSKVEKDYTIYFFTSRDSGKIDDIQADRSVNLSYADKDNQNFLSISGTAKMVDDRQKMEELWQPYMKAWYPDGLETPELTLLRVTPDKAEYWVASSSKLIQAFKMTKAIVTGERHKSNAHEEVEF